MPPFATRRRPVDAFTLIELLVSMLVLTLLIVLISQMVSSATSVTVGNRKHLDADAQARLVFDRMAFDLGKMLKRPDVDYLFAKVDGPAGGANDAMFFFSEAPAYFDGASTQTSSRSSVSLLGYRVNAAYQLERLGKVLTWDGTPAPTGTPGGIVFLSPGALTNPDPKSTLAGNWSSTIGTAPYAATTTDYADYEVLAPQVCRLEFCYQLTNGSFSTLPISPVTTPVGATNSPPNNNLTAAQAPTATNDFSAGQNYAVGSRWYDTVGQRGYVCANSAVGAAVWNYLGLQDVRAIVVALAILDPTSAKIVPTVSVSVNGQSVPAPNLASLVSVLADAPSNPAAGASGSTVPSFPAAPATARLMAEAWGNEINQTNFAQASGLPGTAAGQVRVYQRAFVLNNQ